VGYINPLLALPAAKKLLLLLSVKERAAIAALFTELRHEANELAEASWKRKKGPMAAYYRAVSTYARHVAHVLRGGLAAKPARVSETTVESLLSDIAAARRQVALMIDAAKAALPEDAHLPSDDADAWARRLREAPWRRSVDVVHSIPTSWCAPRGEQSVELGGRDE
jgi:hypothetical protein